MKVCSKFHLPTVFQSLDIDPPHSYMIIYTDYSCGLSTATIENSSLSVCLGVCLSVCLCVCLSVYTITQKIIVQLT